MANFREAALYRQANFLGPVAKVIYSFRLFCGRRLGGSTQRAQFGVHKCDIGPVFDSGARTPPWILSAKLLGRSSKPLLIVGDNTFLWGALWNQPEHEIPDVEVRAMSEFNRRLSDPARYNSILIPSREGMTVAQRL